MKVTPTECGLASDDIVVEPNGSVLLAPDTARELEERFANVPSQAEA